MRILILILLLMGYVYADTTPTEIQRAKSDLNKQNEELKNKINSNDKLSSWSYNPDKSTVYVPTSNGTYGCETGSDDKYHCYSSEYNLPVIQPGMELVKPEGQATVPQPKQYKNVFKLIATVMYMFATVYFLVYIAMELFRKRYMQAFTLLAMYLVGSAILYVAYMSVFNAP